MSLLEMSFAGGVLILAVVVLRSLALHRLPKETFLVLWAVAAARLLLPFSIPSPASVYTLADRVPVQYAARAAAPAAGVLPAVGTGEQGAVMGLQGSAGTAASPAPVWFWLWLAGALLCGAYFLTAWLRCRREFRAALPAEDGRLLDWLAGQKLRRTVSLRRSGRVDAPLTYGLLRPVILLPGAGTEVSLCALEHEMAHIRHLDALWKPLLALAACVHWFNPLAWCMFALANRDMELRCDEIVVRRLGLDKRSEYALTLISLEEKRSGLGPFASAFSKNAIEERIFAIMKLKKRSLAAILAAVALAGCIGMAFVTSAAKKAPYPSVEEGSFTKAELDRLASLWFEGYEDMTVSAYQQKMWSERDNPEDMALIERYGQSCQLGGVYNDEAATKEWNAFHTYFSNVYEPLTAERWQERTFSDVAVVRTADGGAAMMEYDFTMHILDPDVLTVGEYEKRIDSTRTCVERMLRKRKNSSEEQFSSVCQMLSTTTPDGALEITTRCAPPIVSQPTDRPAGLNTAPYADTNPDFALHAQSSRESAEQWDRQLSPYAPFGLTWDFNDPDLDGNGLTMWYQGKEVRGIMDGQEGLWITEHTGNSAYSDGAVELYAVYTDGRLSGLRLATAEEQAKWDAERNGVSATLTLGTATLSSEQREFPQATVEDYASLLTLRTDRTGQMSLEDFNQRLLNWANDNSGAWDRINCDVIWNDCGVQLSEEETSFVSLTCRFSGTENGQRIRALHTGGTEADPGWACNLPEKLESHGDGRVAWCDLYYDISYHISDWSAVTVAERDGCVSGMLKAINSFWESTDLETLLTMTREDVASEFSVWAEENSTGNIRFNAVTGDNLHFEHLDEREMR